MTPDFLASKTHSQLVLIDVQEKLCGAMPSEELARVIRNSSILLQAANLLQVPMLVTEQAPTKLGKTLTVLTDFIPENTAIEKTCFSCYDSPIFCEKLNPERQQIILCGMESHICVLQTAIAMHMAGKQIMVVEDAVISRDALNKINAMQRLRQLGIQVVNTESVVFEWLQLAEGDAFKQISRLIR